MKQIVQSTGKGHLSVIDVPEPVAGPTEVLVETRRSLVSSGTERALRQLAQSSLLKKAQSRPDLVKQVLNRVRTEGLRATLSAVEDKLDAVTPLGYSAAGVVLATGEHAPMLRPGTRVATASAGHAEVQVVPALLTLPVPDEVSDEAAAFGAVAAIAMHGIHQSGLRLGDTVAIAGLGLVGQLTARLAVAAGLKVIGTDLDPAVLDMARRHGVLTAIERGEQTDAEIADMARGRMPDAVIITASTPSSDPVMRAVERVRDRGRVVIVGDVGLDIDRTPFYAKEVELQFARSYGPGRYDPRYERQALDYPVGYVPRTQRTNIAAYLDLVARDRVDVSDLVTRVYGISEASAAYEELSTNRACLAIQFSYDIARDRSREIQLRPRTGRGGGIGLIGTGDFVRAVLLPSMKKAGWNDIAVVASEGGLSAQVLASRSGIPTASTDSQGLLSRADVGTVFIATRHDSHSRLVEESLRAGKSVFCEKPLAIDERGFCDVVDALGESDGLLWMGFNRRHAPAVGRIRDVLSGLVAPINVHYRVSAGSLPDSHWLQDERQGGRLQGEVCHFVDTASWIVGADPVSVAAVGRSSATAVLQEDVTLLISYSDGSTASIEYVTDAHRTTPKERIEVNGRGHTLVVDDFITIMADGQKATLAGGKGHIENLLAFRRAVLSGEFDPAELRTSLSTTQVMFSALRSITSGQTVQVPSVAVREHSIPATS